MQQLARDLFHVFSCGRILVAAREHESGQALLWQAQRTRLDMPARVESAPLDRSMREVFFSPAPIPSSQ